MQITSLILITARRACTVGCQSKSRDTMGLIVYDIVAVKIFDRYRNIVLSIRSLLITLAIMSLTASYPTNWYEVDTRVILETGLVLKLVT